MGTVLHLPAFSLQVGRSLVSVPFSMGTVLHQTIARHSDFRNRCFSPLLDGDGVASVTQSTLQEKTISFSPLLDGDGVASHRLRTLVGDPECFSPLLDGDGVASERRVKHSTTALIVSVPFSMGTVLHRRI